MEKEKVVAGMAERNLRAMVSFLPENILFFSGCWPSTNAAVLVPADGKPTLVLSRPDRDFVPPGFEGEARVYDTRLEDDPPDDCIVRLLRDALKAGKLERGRLGCDRSMETIAATHIGGEAHVPGLPFYRRLESGLPGVELVDCTDWIRQLRMIKTSAEIEALRRCCEIVDHALARARESLRAGLKETELAAVIESAIQTYGVGYQGVKRARGFAFVMAGPRNTEEAWGAFNISTDRRMLDGDLVLIELDSQADGYWSDISRTFVVGGRPDARQREIWEAVRDSQQKTVESLKPGVRAAEVDRTARDAIASRGYGDRFLHHVGHGVGFAFHEMPYLDPASRLEAGQDHEIRPGMVLAIEPGIYLPAWGGIRLEDNVVLTAQGRAEYLSRFDRALA